jgi:hypothetical protein
MNRGPLPGTPSGTDFLARARAAWGDPPDWIVALAVEANRTTLKAAADRIGYSAPVVSEALSATYRGSLARVEERVRGALMGLTVDCPILGDIGRDRCLDEQKEPFRATSAMRARLWHACRGGCRHAKTAGGAA